MCVQLAECCRPLHRCLPLLRTAAAARTARTCPAASRLPPNRFPTAPPLHRLNCTLNLLVKWSLSAGGFHFPFVRTSCALGVVETNRAAASCDSPCVGAGPLNRTSSPASASHLPALPPRTLSAGHLAFGFLALAPTALRRYSWRHHVATLRQQGAGVAAIGASLAFGIVLNNYSLLDISLPLNQVIRSVSGAAGCWL